ncbi:MAG: zinc-binding alcohol dehydrogenase family protein [Candidatus Nanopelagicales bacterium]|nr:zinc-binding alcohol dehydrogenase family protein [Candidatus Nanopelagicales bacterium]MDZ4249734.1 zinc-binding alcohol dehydrogenase family protein [Candidatus Nanopelagicales bacterium]MDZ7578688.1 zinc-binding alcohol dehydrogenase family protein [Candidatus Nanopelagicales bacterium]
MRAIRLVRPTSDPGAALDYGSCPDPEPGPGEVLIQVTASAVCRTDLQLVTGDLPAHKLPVVPGHQVVGRIVALGSDVDSPGVGSRVGLVWQASVCGTCRFCLSGRENLCADARFTGWDRDGGYAQLVTARAGFTHLIPELGTAFSDGLAGDVAIAPLLCGGVIGYRSLRVAGIGPASSGARLGLFGFGASASLSIQIARHFGCRCFVVTRSAAEAERALALGAEWAGTYDDGIPELLDAAITFAPVGWIVETALKALDRGGTVAINAIHLDGVPPLDYDDLWWERSIRSVANVTRSDVREFLALVGPGGIRTETETMPLSEAATALRRVAAGDVRGAFVLLPPEE